MNKRNLIIQAAVAGAFAATSFSAMAGTANGYPLQMAIQAVTGSTAPAEITTGQLAYSTVNPIPIGTAYVYVSLNQGATFLQAAGGAITGGSADVAGTLTTAGALQVANAGTNTHVTVGAGVVSADQTFIVFPITVTVASVPVNTTFTYSPGATNVLGALATAGSVTAGASLTGNISIGTVPTTTAGGASVATSKNVDTPASGSLLNFVQGETFTSLQSGAATFAAATAAGGMAGVGPETAKIDVVTAAGLALTATINPAHVAPATLLNFGGFYFKDVPLVFNADGATAFNVANDYATATSTAVLTGNFAAAQGTGGKVFLTSDNACTAGLATGSQAVINAAGTTATFSAVTLPAAGTGIPTYVCMQVNTPTNTVAIPATTPLLTVTMAPAATSTAAFSSGAAASLYALTTNGGSAYVRTYIPAASAGFVSYIRVINTGSVPANFSAAIVNASTGVTGTAGVLTSAPVPAGGAATFTSSQIETAIKAAGGTVPAASDRPRLLISAPTTIATQSFLNNLANGDFSEVSSGNNGAVNDNQ